MTTGIQCKASPKCRAPAPADTGICGCHQRETQLAAMRHSPSATTRAATRMLSLVPSRDPEREAG